MRLLHYKCSLPPEILTERFLRFPAREQHHPMMIFDEYTDPRLGIHTYPKKNGAIGYYEDGTHKRGGDLQTMKVWFRLSVKPCGEGSSVTCLIYSSPWAILLFIFMAVFAISMSFTDPIAAGIPLGFALFFLFLELRGQTEVKEQILTLAPKIKLKNKS